MARKNATGLGFWTLLFRTLVGAALGAGIVTGIVWLIPRYYTSSTVLLFPGAKGSSGASTSSAPSEGGATADQPSVPLMQGVLSVPRPGTSPSTAALILTSRKVTVDLINRFDLAKEWNRSLERSILRFHERFVCQEGKAGDLRVSFTDRDPQRARAVVEAAIETLKRSVEDLSLDPAARNVDFLRDNVEDAEASCARIQREIVKLQRGLGGSRPILSSGTEPDLNDIQRDLTNAEVDANVAKSSMQATTETAKKMIRAAQDPAGSESMLIRSLYQDVAQKEAIWPSFARSSRTGGRKWYGTAGTQHLAQEPGEGDRAPARECREGQLSPRERRGGPSSHRASASGWPAAVRDGDSRTPGGPARGASALCPTSG